MQLIAGNCNGTVNLTFCRMLIVSSTTNPVTRLDRASKIRTSKYSLQTMQGLELLLY